MSEYTFLFDLDATVTRAEILPEIAARIDKAQEMRELTERTMAGELPFAQSFYKRVGVLKEIPVSEVKKLVGQVSLHEELAAFIRENRNRCYLVTGNLGIWIEELVDRLGLAGRVYCSQASVENDRIARIEHILDKSKVMEEFAGRPLVAVGDGSNDAAMIAAAEIGIGFGGVRPIAPPLLRCATHAVYSEGKLCQFLRQLL